VDVIVIVLDRSGMRKLDMHLPEDAEQASRGLVSIKNKEAFLATLRELRKKGLTKILAEHRLVTVSGRKVTSRKVSDGPAATRTANNSATLSSTSVCAVPVVLEDGRIRLETNVEATQGPPSFRTSSTRSAVCLNDGMTLCLGGLCRGTSTSAVVSKIPIMGDLPLVGSIFRKTTYVESEEDFLFLVTSKLLTAPKNNSPPRASSSARQIP